jgi:hypothetical protein
VVNFTTQVAPNTVIKFAVRSTDLRSPSAWTCTMGDTLCKAVLPVFIPTFDGNRIYVPDGLTKMTVTAATSIFDGKKDRRFETRIDSFFVVNNRGCAAGHGAEGCGSGRGQGQGRERGGVGWEGAMRADWYEPRLACCRPTRDLTAPPAPAALPTRPWRRAATWPVTKALGVEQLSNTNFPWGAPGAGPSRCAAAAWRGAGPRFPLRLQPPPRGRTSAPGPLRRPPPPPPPRPARTIRPRCCL